MSFRDQDVGGAVVKRMFAGHKAGDTLSREAVLAIPGANRSALINQGKMVLFPLSKMAGNVAAIPAGVLAVDHAPEIEHMKRHVVSRGFGKYDVIAGTILNTEPLTKDAAKALAGDADAATH